MRLLLASTPIGRLGSGLGGGVELTIETLVEELSHRGHHIDIVAPAGSIVGNLTVIEAEGLAQPPAQNLDRAAPVTMPIPSVLAAMWEEVRQRHTAYDVVVNFAYDWLPLYLTQFLGRPVAHYLSMPSMSDAVDHAAAACVASLPGSVAVCTVAQAATFAFGAECRVIGTGIDVNRYEFNESPGLSLAWVGRIAPEKALEDALAACDFADVPLTVLGVVQDQSYWEWIQREYASVQMTYLGFQPTDQLQRIVGECQALLMTPRWVEALGIVCVEALACGVPVIAYRRGGPAEIVRDGETGWLVEPDNVDAVVAAIRHISQIDRRACRRQAEIEFSLSAFGDRCEQWLRDLMLRLWPVTTFRSLHSRQPRHLSSGSTQRTLPHRGSGSRSRRRQPTSLQLPLQKLLR